MKRALAIVAVIALALWLRLEVVPFAFGRTPVGDPLSYVQIAHNVLAGNGLVNDPIHFFDAHRAHYPPLYPLLLSAIGVFAPLTAPTFVALNLLTDLATAGALYWIGTLLGFRRSGLIAAAIYLLWPTNILMAPVAQKEGLAALFVCVSVGLLLAASKRPRQSVSIAFGAVAGLLALTQPALVTLPALLALALRSSFKSDWLRTVSVAVAATVVVMLPWWVRNYLIYEQFVPLTTSSGINFWVGTMGNGISFIKPAEHLWAAGDAVAISANAFREALAWIVAHPLEYARHTLGKVEYMFWPDSWNAKPLARMQPAISPPRLLIEFPAYVSVNLFVCSLAGLWMVKGPLRAVVIAGLVQLFAIQLWFKFPERHRYFLVPLLILIAIEGFRRVLASLRVRSALEPRPL